MNIEQQMAAIPWKPIRFKNNKQPHEAKMMLIATLQGHHIVRNPSYIDPFKTKRQRRETRARRKGGIHG